MSGKIKIAICMLLLISSASVSGHTSDPDMQEIDGDYPEEGFKSGGRGTTAVQKDDDGHTLSITDLTKLVRYALGNNTHDGVTITVIKASSCPKEDAWIQVGVAARHAVHLKTLPALITIDIAINLTCTHEPSTEYIQRVNRRLMEIPEESSSPKPTAEPDDGGFIGSLLVAIYLSLFMGALLVFCLRLWWTLRSWRRPRAVHREDGLHRRPLPRHNPITQGG